VASAPVHRATLDNGLVLLHDENPSSLTLAVACFLRVSALMETSESAGWRDLLQQSLLDLPDDQGLRLEERVGDAAAQVRLQTTPDYTEALFQGTTDQLPTLLGFVREVLSDASPDPRDLSRRKQDALRQISGRRDMPLALAQDMVLKALFGGTPCGWPPVGTFAVSTLRPERLQLLRRLHHAPNRAIVVVSGAIPWERAREQAQAVLGPLLPRPAVPEPTAVVVRRRPRAVLHAPWEGDNAVVVFASLCPGPDHAEFAATTVLSAVLASGEGSRLFKALREARGLTYTVRTDLAPSRLCGMLQVAVVCEPQQATEVFGIMRAEVAGLITRPPSVAEVHRAVAYLTGSYLLGRQRNGEIAHYLGMFEALRPGQGDQTDLVALLDQVTVAQVEAATQWLQDRNIWVRVGGKPL
jgi:zinc protease